MTALAAASEHVFKDADGLVVCASTHGHTQSLPTALRSRCARRASARQPTTVRVNRLAARHLTRVLVAGGGVAGIETLLALRALAVDLLDITILAPELKFVNRAMSVDQPFRAPRVRGIRLEDTAAELGAHWHRGTLDRVEHHQHHVVTREGDQIPYDKLVIALGAHLSADGTRAAC